jgi:hypothetical protein
MKTPGNCMNIAYMALTTKSETFYKTVISEICNVVRIFSPPAGIMHRNGILNARPVC